MEYCCKRMEEMDKEEVMDYCRPTTVDLEYTDKKGQKCCCPIFFCPWCGKEFPESHGFVEMLEKAVKEIDEGKCETGSIKELRDAV